MVPTTRSREKDGKMKVDGKDIKDMTADELGAQLETMSEGANVDFPKLEVEDIDSKKTVTIKKEEGAQSPEDIEKASKEKEEADAKAKADAESNKTEDDEKAAAEAKEAEEAKKAEDEAGKSEEEGKTEDENKSEEQKKNDDAMAKMRIELKEEREARAKLEAEKREAEIRKEEREKMAEEAKSSDLPSADEMFQGLAQSVVSEDAGVEATAKRLITQNLSSAEILAVLEKAEAGGFGSLSQDVAESAKDYLSRANARENSQRTDEAAKQTESAEESEAFKARYVKELNQVKEDHPDLTDAESEMSKAYVEWDRKYMGVINADGVRTEKGLYSDEEAAYMMSHPSMRVKTFMQTFKPSATNPETEALKAENAEYRKKLGIADAPEGVTGALSNKSNKSERSADDMLKELNEMGIGV